jgi:hypothetical protein
MLSPFRDALVSYIALNIRLLKVKYMIAGVGVRVNGTLTPAQHLPYEAEDTFLSRIKMTAYEDTADLPILS